MHYSSISIVAIVLLAAASNIAAVPASPKVALQETIGPVTKALREAIQNGLENAMPDEHWDGAGSAETIVTATRRKEQSIPKKPVLSPPQWIIPSGSLPKEIADEELHSNNCVGITLYEGRLFVAWRSAPMHFASTKTKIFIMSSADEGESWEFEHRIELGRDAREPFLYADASGRLVFSFFSAGTNPIAFQPSALLRIYRQGKQQWSDPEQWGHEGEIVWQIGRAKGKYWASSYSGTHYSVEKASVNVFFNVSEDGVNWQPASPDHAVVYNGGVSEVGWSFDSQGNLWAALRNEDGDSSGFGTRVIKAKNGTEGIWTVGPDPAHSLEFITESPRAFRHGDDIYLIARRELNHTYDWGGKWDKLPFEVRRGLFMGSYSLRAHTTALYKFNKETMELEYIFDLPGDGDTAFPSILRIGKDKFLIANYSSPLNHPKWSWIHGQTSKQGTQIYLVVLSFEGEEQRPAIGQLI